MYITYGLCFSNKIPSNRPPSHLWISYHVSLRKEETGYYKCLNFKLLVSLSLYSSLHSQAVPSFLSCSLSLWVYLERDIVYNFLKLCLPIVLVLIGLPQVHTGTLILSLCVFECNIRLNDLHMPKWFHDMFFGCILNTTC